MRKWIRYLGAVVAAVGLLGLAANAIGETCSLELKKVDTSSGSRADYLYRANSSQHFSFPIGGNIRFGQPDGVPKFDEVIEKEPANLQAKHPVRGEVKLGSQNYGYVLDSSQELPEETEDEEATGASEDDEEEGGLLSTLSGLLGGGRSEPERPKMFPVVPYDRLYFDLDCDGDLTDEEVIEATSASSVSSTRNYYSSTFPRVDLPIKIDSTEIDYAFTMRVTAYGSTGYAYVSGSINAAAYREGEIELNGEKHRILLVDFNSNGRFDDATEMNTSIRLSDGRAYADRGDRLYIDPDMNASSRSPYDVTSGDDLFDITPLVPLNGKFYNLTVSPAGDKLTLELSTAPVGHVSNPNGEFRAVIYGDQGVLKIRSDESGKAAVPAGSWKLLSYTLDRTETAKKKEADPDATPSVLDVLSEALGPSPVTRPPRRTLVAASGTRSYDPVIVANGETAAMPFGPPYLPKVDVQYRQGTNQVSLGLALTGTAGEICTNMTVNGSRPGKPKFTITDSDGETVVEDEFEYG